MNPATADRRAGAISPETRFHELGSPLNLESGSVLEGVRIAYRTWGRLSRRRDNAVLVCHALTGSADAEHWWGGLFGTGHAFDPGRDFVICTNVLGSCYGTTGPASLQDDGLPWGDRFPPLTLRDTVHAEAALLDELGIERLRTVVGGSFGGMRALEWALLHPERVGSIVPIAVGANQAAWNLAWSTVQRRVIALGARAGDRSSGLAVGRQLAMLGYRTATELDLRFGRRRQPGDEDSGFAIAGYLDHQGDKLVDRFDVDSYLALLDAMDSHDLGRGRDGIVSALRSIRCPALVVSIDSDLLYPAERQRELVRHLPDARLATIGGHHGHDSFLIETDTLDRQIVAFRRDTEAGPNRVHRWRSA